LLCDTETAMAVFRLTPLGSYSCPSGFKSNMNCCSCAEATEEWMIEISVCPCGPDSGRLQQFISLHSGR